jgi:hypothetical protein
MAYREGESKAWRLDLAMMPAMVPKSAGLEGDGGWGSIRE